MNFKFKKRQVVALSINPEKGLEAIQIDFEQRLIVKYGRKDLEYDAITQEVADMDYFKETLRDLLAEMDIPKGTQLVLNIPSIVFKVADYPASLTIEQVGDAVLEDLSENPLYSDMDLALSIADANVSTIQSNRYASTFAKKTMLIEMAMQIKELGYKLIAIDVSTNSILNALIYNDKVDNSDDLTWLLMIVENSYCRILTMQGNHYADCYEEKISIGKVLGDDENYNIVADTVAPLLNNIPSKYLFVVSTTNLISAEILTNKLKYNAPIIHLDSNVFAKTPFIEANDTVEEDAKFISLDLIGAGIKHCIKSTGCDINLYNECLGNIFLSEKPLSVVISGKKFELSIENMTVLSIILFIVIFVIIAVTYVFFTTVLNKNKAELAQLKKDIDTINAELKANENISSEIFDENSEIKIGLTQNKKIYSYYTLVGTEIPQKLWLTKLELDEKTTIDGRADNLESIYSFYRNLKDYDTSSDLKLQKLELASKYNDKIDTQNTDVSTILSSISADFYQFRISNKNEVEVDSKNKTNDENSETGAEEKKTDKKPPKFIPSSSLETAD